MMRAWPGLFGGGSGARTYALVFGLVYTLVALAGFAGMPAFLMTPSKLNAG